MGLTYLSNKICPRCGTGGYVWYLDNSEYVAKCINCNHYFRREDFPMCVLDRTKKPITNYDRLVSKSPEELAEWLGDTDACPPGECTHFYDDVDCPACWLDWLKKEVKP